MLKNAYERLQIFKKTSSFYHLQTSGLVEKTNGTIMQMLQMILEDWYVLLDGVLVLTSQDENFQKIHSIWASKDQQFLYQKMKTTREELMTEEALDTWLVDKIYFYELKSFFKT